MSNPAKSHLVTRLVLLLTGAAVISTGAALSVRSHLGADPVNALAIGVTDSTDISLSLSVIMVSLVLVGIAFFLGKRPGIATLAMPAAVSIILPVLLQSIPHYEAFLPRLVGLTLGVLLVGVGVGLYLYSDLGASPIDSVAIGLTKHVSLGLGTCIIIASTSCAVLAFLLGQPFGLGTIAMMFGVGPIVAATLNFLPKAENLLKPKPVPALS